MGIWREIYKSLEGMVIHKRPFYRKLLSMINSKPFDLNSAISLSMEIHSAEANGYNIPSDEDKLWQNLTDLIEEVRAR